MTIQINKNDIKHFVDTAARLNLYKNHPDKLYEQLGNFDSSKFGLIRALHIEDPGPINQLRAFVVGLLHNKQPISREIIEKKRDEIASGLTQKSFKSYSNPFSIFFPFLIDPTQKKEKEVLTAIIEEIKQRLSIENKTSHKIVDFFGSQNFGSDRLWFAIYNESHKNQRTAQQLFFELNLNGIFVSHYDRPNNIHLDELYFSVEDFDIEKIILFFKPFVSNIVNDYFKPDSALAHNKNIYKVSHGTNVINDSIYEQLLNEKRVIVNEDTAGLASSYSTQFKDFESAAVGDYFYLCRSNEEIVLVGRFTSQSSPNTIDGLGKDWHQRDYEIIHKSKQNRGYSGSYKKWWMPNFNSTFRIIPKNKGEYELANRELFMPFFDKTIEEIFSEETPPEAPIPEPDFLHGGLFGIKDNKATPSLGVEKLASQFAGIISNLEENTGQVVGVFGPWGRGKTYFVEQVCKALKIDYHTFESADNSPFYFAKFHAWKYQDTKGVWAYLYEQIADRYYDHLNKDEWKKPKDSKFFWCLKKMMIIPLLKWKNEKILLFRLNTERNGSKDIYILFLSLIMIFVNAFLIRKIFERITEEDLKSVFQVINWAIAAVGIISLTSICYKLYKLGKKGKRIVRKYTERPTFNHLLGVQAEIQGELKSLLAAWIKMGYRRTESSKKPFKRFLSFFWESKNNKWEEKLTGSEKRLLLFVDDVDRCSEDRLIQVVDSLRVLLEDEEIAKRLIVITAVDERILSRAILWKYKDVLKLNGGQKEEEKSDILDKLNPSQLLREYMDKLFITGLKLPPLTSNDQNSILTNYAKDGGFLQSLDDLNINDKTENLKEEVENNLGIQGPDDFELEIDEEIAKSGISVEERQAKKNYLLTHDELQWILTEINQLTDLTPRQIRIIMYRYMFAKSLVIEFYGRNRINSIWSEFLVKELVSKSMNENYSLDQNELNELNFKDQEIINFTPKLIEIVVPY